jgi:GT2 family glycosyltransferase
LSVTRKASVFAESKSGQQSSGKCIRLPEAADDVIPVIILNWNGEDDTIECLESFRRSIPAGFVPVMVDNGSKAESVERLRHECSRMFGRVLFLKESELSASADARRAEFRDYLDGDSLVFVENSENMGFAKGNNVGTRFAEIIGADWVMLLNNDTVMSPEAFQELRRFRDTHTSFVAITPQIRHYKLNTKIQNCGGDLTYFARQKYKFANKDASAAGNSEFSVITFITGCALLFKYKVTGPLTEDFFFGEEDYEFSLRLQKLGMHMACDHCSVIYHKLGATIGRSSKTFGAILVYYVNRLINTRNYYSKFRWHTTRILAYVYLPLLFAKSGVDPRRSISAIRRVESYITGHRGVTRSEFQSLVMSNR